VRSVRCLALLKYDKVLVSCVLATEEIKMKTNWKKFIAKYKAKKLDHAT
jgi:hypothetical protein